MRQRIGIAVVEHQGQYLVGTRNSSGPLPGLAEFPGGKCEGDEPARDCAVRECQEETGLVVAAQQALAVVSHEYEHGAVELHFWKCLPATSPGLPAGTFRWVPRHELAKMPFPAGNQAIIELLTGNSSATTIASSSSVTTDTVRSSSGKRPPGLPIIFQVAACFAGLFVLTVFIMIASLFADPETPLNRWIDQHGAKVVSLEVVAVVLAGMGAMAFDKSR